MKLGFSAVIIIRLLLLSLIFIAACQAENGESSLELKPEDISQGYEELLGKIPGLVSLEYILKAIEELTGYSVVNVLGAFQSTVERIITGFTVTTAEIILLLSENKLIQYTAGNILTLINDAILYTQSSVGQAVDLLGWMMSIADVTEELQPILISITVGTYLVPTFIEGLADSLIDIVAIKSPDVSEEIKQIFDALGANITADINSLLLAMLPGQQATLIVGREDY